MVAKTVNIRRETLLFITSLLKCTSMELSPWHFANVSQTFRHCLSAGREGSSATTCFSLLLRGRKKENKSQNKISRFSGEDEPPGEI